MGRPRKASAVLGSQRECEDAMRRLGLAQIRLERLQGDVDRGVMEAKALFENPIAKAADEAKDLELQLQQYYLAHVEEFEREGRRSVALLYGVMGRRQSPPALKLLNKSWTWAAVLVRLREKFRDRFIRMKDPEVDKDAVKAAIAAAEIDGERFGLKVEQEDVFYAEPDRAKVEVE